MSMAIHEAEEMAHHPGGFLKFGMAVLVTILTALAPLAVPGHHISHAEWVNVIITGLGAVTVVIIPNLTGGIGHYAKYVVGAITAAMVVLSSLLAQGAGVGLAEIIQMLIAAVGALGIFAVPNMGGQAQAQRPMTRPAVG